VQHQFAHVVHQLVEPLGVDAHGQRALRLVAAGGRGADRRLGDLVLFRRLDRRLHGDGPGERDQRLVGLLGRKPGVQLAAVERIDVLLQRGGRDQLALLRQRGQDHVGAHGGHLDVVGELDVDAHDAAVDDGLGGRRVGVGRLTGAVGGLVGRALAHEAAQLCDQRLGDDLLGPVGLDRVDSLRQRVEAAQQHGDGVAAEPAAALAQQLEHILHLVRQRRHAGEPHRRAHALERVRDAEDLVDGLGIVGVLLDPDDREVELLEVFAALGEEHRQVFGDVHRIRRPCDR
jgi:hypothetical protein